MRSLSPSAVVCGCLGLSPVGDPVVVVSCSSAGLCPPVDGAPSIACREREAGQSVAMRGDKPPPILLTVSSDEPAPTAQKVLLSDPMPGLESAPAQGVRPTIHRQANAEMVSVRQFAPKPGSL